MSSGCEYCGYDWDKGHNAVCVMNEVARLEAEVEGLRNVAADLMDLVNEMPIKHPQQVTRRKILAGQCRQFGVPFRDEQQEPPLIHVGRDGEPHNGPRAVCTICHMWQQIANEQNAPEEK